MELTKPPANSVVFEAPDLSVLPEEPPRGSIVATDDGERWRRELIGDLWVSPSRVARWQTVFAFGPGTLVQNELLRAL